MQNKLIHYEIIHQASLGDTLAINKIVNHYTPYINALSTFQLVDEYDRLSYVVDEEAAGRLKTKLITKILSFNPEPLRDYQ